MSIFFDLEKVYDTTWKYGIMKDLHGMDLRGRLPLSIQNLLPERKFRVRVGTSLSDLYDQEMGVPQGSILFGTLFIVKINSITRCIRNGVDKSLFVHDFGVSYRSTIRTTILLIFYDTKWSLCADVPLSNHSFIDSNFENFPSRATNCS